MSLAEQLEPPPSELKEQSDQADPPGHKEPRILPVSRVKALMQGEPAERPEVRDVLGGRSSPLRGLAFLAGILAAGTGLGIGSAAYVIRAERPLATTTIGPWTANPSAGTRDADPYAIAIYTRSARVPMALGEGLTLTAYQDSAGQTLRPDCDYRIEGSTPTARLWTLTAGDGHGDPVPTLSGRMSLVSEGLLRREDGSFRITASPVPSSGNWLPLDPAADALAGLSFTFRLYDAPVTTGSSLEGAVMPEIRRLGCR